MYVPRIHRQEDRKEVFNYIRKNGFATLISKLDGRSIATHLPLYLDKNEKEEYVLIGHIAAANEQKESLSTGEELLAIFMDTHAYISSSWYDHINVPT